MDERAGYVIASVEEAVFILVLVSLFSTGENWTNWRMDDIAGVTRDGSRCEDK